ncbi:MAG: hypothetical protein JWM05_2114, partial [Acidimicrobiales bacterium]|nr:hypothetical protein [Acidimicrobiales bacterium]
DEVLTDMLSSLRWLRPRGRCIQSNHSSSCFYAEASTAARMGR